MYLLSVISYFVGNDIWVIPVIVLSNSLYPRCVPIEYDLFEGNDTWVIPVIVLSNSLYLRCTCAYCDMICLGEMILG